MTSNKKIGRYAGLLFLIGLIPYVIGQIGILEQILYEPDFLSVVYEQRRLVGLAIILKWISLSAMIAFAVLIFTLLRSFGNRLAIGYLGLRFIEFGMLIMGGTKVMSIVSLSKIDDASVNSFNEVLANRLLIEWEWIGFIYMFAFALHCFAFYYLLFLSEIIPKIISIGGLIAATLVLANTIFGILDLDISGFYLFAPIGLVELLVGVWLLIFGLKKTYR